MMTHIEGVDACSLVFDSTGEGFTEMQLQCLICGAPARLEGR